nr:hypothetical protein CFP56_26066 [Quercus suber]
MVHQHQERILRIPTKLTETRTLYFSYRSVKHEILEKDVGVIQVNMQCYHTFQVTSSGARARVGGVGVRQRYHLLRCLEALLIEVSYSSNRRHYLASRSPIATTNKMQNIRQKIKRKLSIRDTNPDLEADYDEDDVDEETTGHLHKEIEKASEEDKYPHGKPGSFLNKLIMSGNKKTEEQLARESSSNTKR